MCVCVCVYIYIHTHTHAHTHRHKHTHTYAYTHILQLRLTFLLPSFHRRAQTVLIWCFPSFARMRQHCAPLFPLPPSIHLARLLVRFFFHSHFISALLSSSLVFSVSFSPFLSASLTLLGPVLDRYTGLLPIFLPPLPVLHSLCSFFALHFSSL